MNNDLYEKCWKELEKEIDSSVKALCDFVVVERKKATDFEVHARISMWEMKIECLKELRTRMKKIEGERR